MNAYSAISSFFKIRGDDLAFIDSDEINDAVKEIGNPSANLPVTKTTETNADFLDHGWTFFKQDGAITILKRGKRTFANIADCGDYRLIYIES